MPVRFAPDATFPNQLVVEADVRSNRLADPAGVLAAQLTSLIQADAVKGKRIAIGVGSRGIDHIPDVVRATAAFAAARTAASRSSCRRWAITAASTDEGQAGHPRRPRHHRSDRRRDRSGRAWPRSRSGATPAGVPVHVAEEALDADGVVLSIASSRTPTSRARASGAACSRCARSASASRKAPPPAIARRSGSASKPCCSKSRAQVAAGTLKVIAGVAHRRGRPPPADAGRRRCAAAAIRDARSARSSPKPAR